MKKYMGFMKFMFTGFFDIGLPPRLRIGLLSANAAFAIAFFGIIYGESVPFVVTSTLLLFSRIMVHQQLDKLSVTLLTKYRGNV